MCIRWASSLALSVLFTAAACSSSGVGFDAASDAGSPDAHALDAAASDRGSAGNPDVLPEDAALASDAEVVEAGEDASSADAGEPDAAQEDASATDGGCSPTGQEICDGLDNDCSGFVDDLDVAGDGIYDCLRIALFGQAGAFAASNFMAWLESNGVSVVRLQTDTATLSSALLAGFDIIILDQLVRSYAASEATLLREWVDSGGGLMSMTGYTGGGPDRTRPNELMAEIGIEYLASLHGGPVTEFLPHATTSSLTSITFSGGYLVGEAAGVGTYTSTVVARIPAGPVAIAQERGRGRVFVWGDEWVEFDSEWSTLPEVPIFWANVLGWLSHFR